jgi:hypothetical protein
MTSPPPLSVVTVALLIGVGGCASAHTTKLAACDGRHRRAVNIHGSILGEVPAIAAGQQPAPAPRPSAGSPSPQAAKPTRVSVANGTPWHPSC